MLDHLVHGVPLGRVVPGLPARLCHPRPGVADQLVEASAGDPDGGDGALNQAADVVHQVALETVAGQQGEHQLRVVGAAGDHGADGREHDAGPAGPGARRHPPHGHRGGLRRQFHRERLAAGPAAGQRVQVAGDPPRLLPQVVQCRLGPGSLGWRRLQPGLVQWLVAGSAGRPNRQIVEQAGEVALEDLDRVVVHRQVPEPGGARDDPVARAGSGGHRHAHRAPGIGGLAQPPDERLGHRGTVLRSPLSLAERADLQRLDAGRRDPLARLLAGQVAGAQGLVPRDQHRDRPGHVAHGHQRRHRELGAQDRVEVVRDPAQPRVTVELAQGERSLAGPLPGELDRDRPHRGQPHAAPALTGIGFGAHHWSACLSRKEPVRDAAGGCYGCGRHYGTCFNMRQFTPGRSLRPGRAGDAMTPGEPGRRGPGRR